MLTKRELEKKEKEKNKKIIKALMKEMALQRADFVRNMIETKMIPKDINNAEHEVWITLLQAESYVSKRDTALFFANTKKGWYELQKEEKDAAVAVLEKTPVFHQMMIMLIKSVKEVDILDWGGRYNAARADGIIKVTEVLEQYGFSYSGEEYYKVMEGTHECYVKEENNG